MCYCQSHHLYSEQNQNQILKIFNKQTQTLQNIDARVDLKNVKNPQNSIYLDIFKEIIDQKSISFPNVIERISILDLESDPLLFQQQYLGKNVPVIIENATDHWEALDNWSDTKYLCENMGQNKISVDITPDVSTAFLIYLGFADSIKNKYFVQPAQKNLTLNEFLDIKEQQSYVAYIQKQCDNFNGEFEPLQKDIDFSLKEFFSDTYFKMEPDAFNFWMGQSDSVSSMHKDHYENLYAVVNGEKHFTLIPPAMYPFLCEGTFTNSNWVIDQNNEFYIQENQELPNDIQWISVNPDSQDILDSFPLINQIVNQYKYHIILKPGEILYLPSLWYHQVSQYSKSNQYINAINFWWDMDYGSSHFTLYNTLRSLVKM